MYKLAGTSPNMPAADSLQHTKYIWLFIPCFTGNPATDFKKPESEGTVKTYDYKTGKLLKEQTGILTTAVFGKKGLTKINDVFIVQITK